MSRLPLYQIEVRHDGLNKYRHITGRDKYVVEEKARAQRATWNEQWRKKQEIETRKAERQQAAEAKEAKKALALERTEEAAAVLKSLELTLAHTLSVDDAIVWAALKNTDRFPIKRPSAPSEPKLSAEPIAQDPNFQANFGFFDFLIPGRKAKKTERARALFMEAHQKWHTEKRTAETAFAKRVIENQAAIKEWEAQRDEFDQEQKKHNLAIGEQQQRYQANDPDAITEYCDLVLSNSEYPDFMPKEYELEFNGETGILVIEYRLPSVDDLPTLKEIKYVQSRDALDEVHLKSAALNKIYDNLIYQICLRTIHEIYEADVINSINSVVFNGWVNYTDKATGNDTHACIMSVQAGREEFLAINLANVDPKACFKSLKGVGSTKLHSMAPIAPLIRMSREDSRFVESVDIAGQLDVGTNLAAIGWEEFEHLIREIFEKEFSKSGGEVKVTQASRDGGVDAIAFDPDPIRGGKIVIQAKRYTNPVGVSAVRDLYGTVMNEGATKGILVTTSTYGPDAYEFCKDKPITLLDGGNLLHLLGQHGHDARIDLAEAKRIAKESLE